ncbi:hypothetical protein [Rosenbergiella nectarea]|uniref:hypothetical protein n=1 Tax=Rosenbergiella nectarea TaxID=988801 RepID=UPI001BDA1EDF|nr:hypothetical protein [Rosenbergiella nectarea]MBT0729072.1 hypothetical protein [Rosenbergiella nectarea subsp. apis]
MKKLFQLFVFNPLSHNRFRFGTTSTARFLRQLYPFLFQVYGLFPLTLNALLLSFNSGLF